MQPTNTQVLFRREPHGLPTPEDFEIVNTALPDLTDGQFLISNLYLSLDPYMRMLMGGGWTYSGKPMTPGQVMVGRVLGVVRESKNSDFDPGEHVVGRLGWQTHAVSDGTNLDFKVMRKHDIPLTAYLGACGSNGVTAWAGLKMIGEPKAGETVVVSAAAGSVGSAVGQIAKAMGCGAIGIAGGQEKCRIVTEEFGFDACCDYKRDDLAAQIRAVASDGVDVYFDNVGGKMLDSVLPCLNRGARVPVCGVLSQYNVEGEPYGVKNTRLIFDKKLRLQGFLLSDYRELWGQARAELEELVASGHLRYRETIAKGIENAPIAFIGMLQGGNIGKQLVQLV
ncbi:MAG: NADP-dependent oxidoreductase [Acidiferrobacterales bacterium]|nr:NADP-dependent oxidoreductase [Acidiferrobacterales bacterium]